MVHLIIVFFCAQDVFLLFLFYCSIEACKTDDEICINNNTSDRCLPMYNLM